MANQDGGKREKKRRKGGRRRTAGRAAVGLGTAAAAAYSVYLLGSTRTRRFPVTELGNALGLPLGYVRWRDRYYAHYTRKGRGRPLVLLHGISAVASAHEMAPLARAFAAAGRPLFALEWLGFGHSDRPDLQYTPELLEDQLEHYLAEVVRPVRGADVVAFSLGATYAAEVARREPGLVHTLTAIEPAGLGSEPGGIGAIPQRLLFTLPGVQRAFYDRLTTRAALRRFARENLFSSSTEVPEEYVEYGAETARAEGASRPLDDFLSGRLFPADAVERFASLRQPLLICVGTVEERRMDGYERLPELERREGVEVVRLTTGALPHWERSAEVAERIRGFQAAGEAADPVPA